jgi:cytochrome P450
MMGIPESDWEILFHTVLRTVEPNEAEQQLAHTELLLYFSDLVGERRRRPADDLVSIVASIALQGTPLSDEEVILNCSSLILAGVDTTRLAAAGGLHALLQHPEQWKLLRDDHLLVLAVEEVLRWTSPALHLDRTVTRDLVLGSQRVLQSDRVVVWIPSLNRDEQVFSSPDSFVISRSPNPHMGFGIGVHLCIGAALARMELRLLFRELVRVWQVVAEAGEAKRLPSILVHGIHHLPVSVSPA